MRFAVKQKDALFFGGCIVLTFGMILFYNILTPYFTDDIYSKVEVNGLSFRDLIVMQYDMYVTYNPRVVGQFFRAYFSTFDKHIFNFFNSIVFISFVYLIVLNITIYSEDKKLRYNPLIYLITFGFVWRYSVDFGDTILWLSGACNYLWTSTIILAFITFYRFQLKKPLLSGKRKVRQIISLFFFGVIAGWCNENTSGGMMVIIFFLTLTHMVNERFELKVKSFMIAAHLGALTGFIGLLLSPGAYKRMDYFAEEHSGAVGIMSRFYHILVSVNVLFFELLCAFIIVTVLAIFLKKKKVMVLKQGFPFFIAGLATCFALIIIPPVMVRAYFGAGAFLIIAFLQSLVLLLFDKSEDAGDESRVRDGAVRMIVVSVLWLWLFFEYSENLVNLGRIQREENERIALIITAKERGDDMAVVPQYRKEFDNRYSSSHRSDMTEDEEYWINGFYEGYYGVMVRAVPRAEWDGFK
ncbi:MAG: DUF6056 family protein [Lachnospiraceae bacterium]|nr:DUF6056 family protein [Lachnospiraceae bacterium]